MAKVSALFLALCLGIIVGIVVTLLDDRHATHATATAPMITSIDYANHHLRVIEGETGDEPVDPNTCILDKAGDMNCWVQTCQGADNMTYRFKVR